MAVYWVDPYIEASIGGIHGTTDTVSRSGTYAAPWALSDMYGTSTTGNTTLSGLSDGDEIRFKGLSQSSYLIDAGSDWYPDSTNISKASTLNSATLSAISSWGNTGLVVMYDTTATNKFTVADSDGNKPLVFTTVYVSSTSSPSNAFLSSTAPHGVLHTGPLRAEGTSSANAALQMYLVDPQYYITSTITGNRYFCQYADIGIKVTDGWTSSTTRDGYTVLPIYRSSPTTGTVWYFNNNTNTSAGPDTLYDMPNTYFVLHNNSGTSYTYGNFYICSAMGGYHSGYTYTQRIGGIHANGSSSASIFDYTGYYYYNGAGGGSTGALGINGCEVNIASVLYYGIRGYKRYGSTTSSEWATYRYNNVFSYYYMYQYQQVFNDNGNYYIGTCMTFYMFERGLLLSPSTSATITINLLDGAYFWKYGQYGGGLFTSTQATMVSNFSGTIYNYDGSALASRVSVSGEGPEYLYEAQSLAPYRSNPKMNPASWTDGIGAAWVRNNSSTAFNTSTIAALGVLDVGIDDYTTGSCKFKVGSDAELYRYNEASGPTIQTNMVIHTNGNTADGLPIGMALSTEKTNLTHPPMLYYNDPDKSGALCFVSNDQADNVVYRQSLEVPITGGAYTSSSTIRLKARLETSSSWTSSLYVIGAWYYNTSNEPTFQTIQSSSTAVTTATDYTYDLAASSLYDAGNNYRFLRFIIYVTNRNSTNQKLWVHELSATVV